MNKVPSTPSRGLYERLKIHQCKRTELLNAKLEARTDQNDQNHVADDDEQIKMPNMKTPSTERNTNTKPAATGTTRTKKQQDRPMR
jgi:hypothetical protein